MNPDDMPLPWDHQATPCLTETVAFHGQHLFDNNDRLDLRLADGRVIRPREYQDIMYIRCLSHTFAFPQLNYAAIYEIGLHTSLFLATRPTINAISSGPRSIVTAYQYREKSNRDLELWLLTGQKWHWVRQSLPDRLQMIMQSLNDSNRYVVTFEADSSGEAKDIRVEWINR